MLPFYLSLEIPSLSVSPDNLMHTRKYVASLDPPLISEAHDAMLSIRRLAEMDEYVKDLRTRIRDRVAEMFPIAET